MIVCCDGTWNQLDTPCPTNVIKIAQAIKPVASDGVHQIAFYEEGLGTKWYDKLPGGALGWGIDQNIQHAYRFLCLNYMPGDEIYLFGFSRGAYTVRSLAGLIYCSGLLSRPHICKAPEAYRLYRDPNIKPAHAIAVEFRKNYGDRVPITLLGCWDTVGSLGIPDVIPILPVNSFLNAKYKFHNTCLSSIIQNALHAVAIDELRKPFEITPMQKNPDNPEQRLHQVWFPGVHGCVGGGTDYHRGLSDGALQWMMDEIGRLNLKLDFDPARIEGGITPDPVSNFNSSLGFYRFAGTLPRQGIVGIEELHDSVKIRWYKRSDYRPLNLSAVRDLLDAYIHDESSS
nr:DUF2235 domain-containing protein [Oculatella sp. LEGE 06141]